MYQMTVPAYYEEGGSAMGNAARSMNIVSQKYDATLDYHVTMYDNLPYKRDAEYCNIEKVALYSGRVIKYYACANQPDCVLIDNKDNQMEQILARLQLEMESLKAHQEPEVLNAVPSDEVTAEQIQSLLDDKNDTPNREISEEDDNLTDAPEDAVNAFSDVEDW